MPGINMFIQLSHRLVLDLKRTDTITLDLLAALEDILDADLVRGQCSPGRPLTAYAIDDEVVGEFWDGDGEIHAGLGLELVGHLDAVYALNFESGCECEVESSGTRQNIDFMQLPRGVDDALRHYPLDLAVDGRYVWLDECLKVAITRSNPSASGRPAWYQFLLQLFMTRTYASVHLGLHGLVRCLVLFRAVDEHVEEPVDGALQISSVLEMVLRIRTKALLLFFGVVVLAVWDIVGLFFV